MTSRTTTEIPSDLRGAFERFPFQGAEGLHTPELGDLEKAYLSDCIDSGFVSSVCRRRRSNSFGSPDYHSLLLRRTEVLYRDECVGNAECVGGCSFSRDTSHGSYLNK